MKIIKKYVGFMKEPWYVQGFNSCNAFICQGPRSALVDCYKCIGYGYTKILFIFTKDYLEFHYSTNDFSNMGKTFMKKQKENPSYFDWLIKESRKLEGKAEAYRQKFKKINIKKVSTAELIKWFHEFVDVDSMHLGYSHVIEGITYVGDPMLEKGLMKALAKKGLEKRFKEYFNALTQPTKPSLVNKENISILQIARSISRNKNDFEVIKKEDAEGVLGKLSVENRDRIKEHTDRYFWIQINYYKGDPLTETDFIRKVRKIIEASPDFDSLIKKEEESYEKNRNEKERIINEIGLSNELVELFEMADKNMYWQDDRKKHMLTCVYHFDMILKELADRYDIPFEHAKQLVPEEINEGTLESIDKNNLKQRAEKCIVLLSHNGKTRGMDTEIIIGKDYEDFLREFRKEEVQKVDDLRGTCASAGKAIGRVKVCRTINDINRFKEGEVLVASMTRPEFVPAMKKAIAIVTDEGGITSHAAIISRELGLPCIIGTKVATKVLKDGDVVEIKGNHGLVIILERAK